MLRRSRRTGRLYPLFVAGRAPLTTIQAGDELLLSFRLSARARRLLRQRGALTMQLRGLASRGGPPLVAREARLRITLR